MGLRQQVNANAARRNEFHGQIKVRNARRRENKKRNDFFARKNIKNEIIQITKLQSSTSITSSRAACARHEWHSLQRLTLALNSRATLTALINTVGTERESALQDDAPEST